jgi:hypothetical protein
MPSQTFNIKYRQGDFFYNTADKTKNADLLRTFPFSKEAVIKWANKVKKLAHPIVSITDIFDPQISGIILNPANDFENSFLKGNLIFNDSFNQITFNLSNPPPSTTQLSESTDINGTVTLVSNNSASGDVHLDINPGSSINWTQDATNSWQPNVDIETKLLSKDIPFTPITFTDTDGGTSKITMTTENPRCKYRETCTLNHWHYSGSCQTQIVTNNKTGSTYCKCICSGVPVFDDSPHSHCDTYTVNSDGTGTTAVGTRSAPDGLGLIQTIQGIKGVKMNLSANFPKGKFGSSNEKITLGYKDVDALKKTDQQIRHMIFQYYQEVYKNIELQKKVNTSQTKDTTMSQSMMDATVQYKTEYLNVFNIVVGIFCVTGYIYTLEHFK